MHGRPLNWQQFWDDVPTAQQHGCYVDCCSKFLFPFLHRTHTSIFRARTILPRTTRRTSGEAEAAAAVARTAAGTSPVAAAARTATRTPAARTVGRRAAGTSAAAAARTAAGTSAAAEAARTAGGIGAGSARPSRAPRTGPPGTLTRRKTRQHL